MNKTVSIIFIILLSIVTIFLTGFFVVLLKSGASISSFSFNIGMGGGNSETLVYSKEYEEIENLDIDFAIGDIYVEENSSNSIVIELYSDRENEKHSITEKDGTIYVVFNKDVKKVSFMEKNDRIIVKIPEDYAKKMNINMTTGDINGDDFENLELEVTLKTGDIEFGEAQSMKLDVQTGDIEVEKVLDFDGRLTTGDIDISTVENLKVKGTTGDIKINNVTRKINASLNVGDIKISKATISADSSIKLKTGDVKINTLKGAYIDASTNIGDTRVKNNDRLAENVITINTNIGDIRCNS